MRRKLWHTAERTTLATSPARPKEAAAEMTFGLQVSDDELDGGAAAQFAHYRRRLPNGTAGIWRPPISWQSNRP